MSAAGESPSADVARDWITYAEFGERFFAHAVTEARIVGALKGIAGEPIEFGPIGAGPGKIAKVSASGKVGVASASPVAGEHVAFRLSIPVALDLHIDLGLDQHTFHATLDVGLNLTARAADPLRVVVEVDAPTSEDVTVKLESERVRSEVLRRVAGVDAEIRRFVAKYIAREIDKPHIQAARDIDVAARIDKAWRA